MVGKIILAGGDELQPGCEEMDRQIVAVAGGPSARITFLPTAVARHHPQASAQLATAYFKRLGASCEVAMVLNRADADRREYVEMIERASIVYLAGGDPDVVLEVLRGTEAWGAAVRVYERGGVVGGSSAGAMAMCTHMLLPNRTTGGAAWDLGEGLCLIDRALVLPHYTEGRASQARSLRARLNRERAADFTIFGIPEHTALLGYGARWDVVGPGQVTVLDDAGFRVYREGIPVLLAETP